MNYIPLIIIGSLIMLVAWKVWGAIENDSNNVQWYHLISSEGRDGKQYGSATKVCMLVTFLISTMLVVWIASQVDWTGRAVEVLGLITAWMLFGAGIEGYAKHLRAKAKE